MKSDKKIKLRKDMSYIAVMGRQLGFFECEMALAKGARRMILDDLLVETESVLDYFMSDEVARRFNDVTTDEFVAITGGEPYAFEELLDKVEAKTEKVSRVRFEELIKEWHTTPREQRNIPLERVWDRYRDELQRLRDDLPYRA